MKKYLLGLLFNLFNFRISKFALVDNSSVFDKTAKIYRKCLIFNSSVGAYSYVAPNTSIVCAEVGKFCSIAKDVNIGLGTHSMKLISTSPIFVSKDNAIGISWTFQNRHEDCNKVIVGNDVWIGTKAIIMGGVKIGDGAIIGAGSIVTKDVPDYAVAVGIPAKVIKYRFDKPIIEKLLELRWWDMSEEKLKEKIALFQNENILLDDLTGLKSNPSEIL